MNKKQSFIVLGFLGMIAYATRRRWIARWLRLPRARYAVGVEHGIRIPMSDGVGLIADHYFPKTRGEFPTILIRTPYGRDLRGTTLGILHMFVGQRFAERGYHVIVQDVRGRFDSEGEWEPFVHEAHDGRATLDWIARQSWFNGNLGMWGPSYEGYVQWAAAVDAPSFLKAIVPSITGSQINPYTGSAFGLSGMLRWIANLDQNGRDPRKIWTAIVRALNPQAHTRALAPAFDHLPLGESDKIVVRQSLPHYRTWLDNPRTDAPFWKSIYHGTRMDRVNAAAHFVSGWHDMLLYQLLIDYQTMRAAGHLPFLTIGPWRHLDAACAEESLRVGIEWFNAILKGNRRGLRANPVRIFLMGAHREAWREFPDWPPPAQATRLYLCDRKKLTLELPAADSPADHYRYDPADPTPSLGGPLYQPDAGPQDNRPLEARADVLTYTTPPLAKDADVIGWVRLELFARSSLPHADFFGRLCDVYPDGRSINICDGLFRVEPGNAEPQADGSRRMVIEMWATAQRFVRGHRLRLQVSSGAHPRWNRNLGTGEPIATATRMLAADQTVFHDAAHPSALILPIFGADSFEWRI
jgi:uncharacterized protein